jgi:phosphoserine phosphatase RsbU/P
MDVGTEPNFKVLTEVDPGKDRNQAISQIASSFLCVDGTKRIETLTEDLTMTESTQAVGVVDTDGRVTGLIVRNDFLNLLGRPYGRDVLRNSLVAEVMTTTQTFKHDANIFSIAEELDAHLKLSEIAYFPLTDEHGGFRGIFSTHDLLLFLSTMTTNDIALARKLLSRIVRERDLVVGRTFEFASHSSAAKGVGGDFYSIFRYTDDDWLISLCDVSGKGIAASIVTSVIWGMMSIYDFKRGLKPFIQKLNNHVAQTFEAEKFITGLFMTYNEASGELQIVDMGHSHLFILRSGKMLRVATNQKNMPIGVTPDADPKVSRFVPRTNDVLLMITDGLVEQENVDGETYSIERVSELLRGLADKPVEEINDRLSDDFETFRGNHHLNDDVTYGIIKFAEQEVVL